MNIACHYALVRFMPFVETGEFGNVGVVVFAPSQRYFGFQLLGQRISRITQFFEPIEPKALRASMRATREELQRVCDMLKGMGTDQSLTAIGSGGAARLWQEILKPRENLVRMSESRLVLANDPQTKLRELFAYYVERDFVTHEYQELLMERSLRGWLREAQLSERFHSQRVGNDEYSAPFPFVAQDGELAVKAIKPLRLDHAQPAQIIDHGGLWRIRVQELKKRDLLPREVLFAFNGDPSGQSALARARRGVVDELQDLGVHVLPSADRQAVIHFAGASV